MPFDYECDALYERDDESAIGALPLRVTGEFDAERMTEALCAIHAKVRFKGERWTRRHPHVLESTHGSFTIRTSGSLADQLEQYCKAIESMDDEMSQVLSRCRLSLDAQMRVPWTAFYEQHVLPPALLERLSKFGINLIVTVYSG